MSASKKIQAAITQASWIRKMFEGGQRERPSMVIITSLTSASVTRTLNRLQNSER
jgi:hypothetical protein